MTALEITNIRDFMTKLLLSDTFDRLQTVEASITTYNSFRIDGTVHPEYYEEESSGDIHGTYSLWKDLKPFCLSIIKGKRTPLRFRIVFILGEDDMEELFRQNEMSSLVPDINSLVMTVNYDNLILTCTSGISLRTFSLDKSAGKIWDKYVADFLDHHEIPYEIR